MSKIGHRLTVIIGGIVACLASVASVFAPSVAVLNVTAGLFTGEILGCHESRRIFFFIRR